MKEDDGWIIVDPWDLSFPTAFAVAAVFTVAATATNSGNVGGRRGGGSDLGLGLGLGLAGKKRTDKGMRSLEEYEFVVPVL